MIHVPRAEWVPGLDRGWFVGSPSGRCDQCRSAGGCDSQSEPEQQGLHLKGMASDVRVDVAGNQER